MGSRLRRCACAAALIIGFTSLRAQVNVTTYHNDNARTGQNLLESTLTPANVNSSQFGKLFSVVSDGAIYAQPLYLSNVTIGGGAHNVAYVATEHDSVYAIDAETGRIYWQRSLIPTGGSTVSSADDIGCGDIAVEVGITGTPVIDSTIGTLYVVAKVKLNGVISQYLHALDVTTGADKFGGPVDIQASVPGTAPDGNGATVTFNPRKENQRPALLLENGHIVIGWASHCDTSPWHGWVMSYGSTTLTLEGVYNSSPNGYGNGIWMSGGGLAADGGGNIFFATGNGSWDAVDRGDSVVKLGAPVGSALPQLDYFTPYDQATYTTTDRDVSAGGVLLLPTLANGKQLAAVIGKAGTLYLLDRTNLGKYCIARSPPCTDSDTNIVQEIPGVFTGYWGTPAYWNGHVYFAGGNDDTGRAEPLKAYSFDANGSGLMSTSPTSVSALAFHFSGPMPSISADGTTNGILWGLDNGAYKSSCAAGTNCQVLYAYDAANLATMLYNSSQAAKNRDVPGSAIKFTTPTIANGRVYVASKEGMTVYGLLNAVAPTTGTPALSPGTGTYTSPLKVSLSDTTPGAQIYYTTNGSTPTTASTKYSAALSLSSSTSVKAIAAASGYSNSAVASAAYTISSAGPGSTPVNLGSASKVYGIAKSGTAVTGGGLDTHGDAYSAALLGSTLTWDGVKFDFDAAGVSSAVSDATIALPAGSYSTLNLLATAVLGDQPGQKFVVTYTDGSTTTITQSLSDWLTPHNYPGESKALSMTSRVGPNGAIQGRDVYLYGYSFAIDSAKTLKSLTLPDNRSVVVLAVTVATAATSVATRVNLGSAANVFGLFKDGSPVLNGGLDTHNDAYSAVLLGSSLTWSGTTFSLGAAGTAAAATTTTIPLPAGKFSKVQLLATGVFGNQISQKFIVTYTDGTATEITQSLSDWHTSGGYPGEAVVATMAYRLLPTGARDSRTFYLYGYSFDINSAKTVAKITLPNNTHTVVVAATLLP